MAAVLTVVAAFVLAYAHRYHGDLSTAFSVRVGTLGYALPGSVLAVGVMLSLTWIDNRFADAYQWLFGRDIGLLLSGTVMALLMAYFVRFLAVAYGPVDSGLERIRPSIRDAARSLGAGQWETVWRVYLPMLRPGLLTAVPFLLILIQPDLGTALMMAILFFSMILFARVRWATLNTLGLTGLACAWLGWKYGLKPYQRRRIETFLNPEAAPMNHGYQIKQSNIAVGSGRLFGKGFLEGTQGHLNFLPERHTDFAFAVWCEELGFVGSMFFLVCYFFLLLWGINIAVSARDKFGVFLAFGLVMLIFWQAVINLFMIMGLLPVVGIPLPLFSYGGSSLLTTLAAVGILMNIHIRRFHKR